MIARRSSVPASLDARLSAAFAARDLKAALKLARQSVQMAPGNAIAHTNLSVVLTAMRRLDEAAVEAMTASRLDPRNPTVAWNRGQNELARGNLEQGGGRFFEARLFLPQARRFAFTSTPPAPWRGDPLRGRKILLRWEEGYGDTLQMLRYVPCLISNGAQVVLDVQKPLVELAATLAPALGTLEGEAVDVAADFWAPLFSLPRLCGETLAEPGQPYLAAPQEAIDAWRRRLANLPRPWIAVQWRGASHNQREPFRSVPFKRMFDALSEAPSTLISLQVERQPDEKLPPGTIEAGPGFMNIAALMAVCDAVVSVDTAMAHLAGAVGCPLHVLLAHDTCWRWLMPQATNWYQSVRLYHQQRPDDWGAPLASLRKGLFEPERP